ncbi:MAG: 50S ribosomal protein L9 [Planctomycetes bacterium]|nr:50S ribosomal protein L9 [Planctomycetota bacterium]
MKEVLLWRDIDKLGKRGEVVRVADGYARNYLFPHRLASLPTPQNLKELEYEKKRQSKKAEKLKTGVKDLATQIEKTSCTIEVKANEDGTLFGAVSPQLIIDALKQEGAVGIEPGMIELEMPIKELGVYRVTVRLHSEVSATCGFWVGEESEDAKKEKS